MMESPLPKDHPYSRKYKTAPHPYIIIPPLSRKRFFKPEDLLSFDIVLVGNVHEYLPYFVYAFIEMGRIGIEKHKGKFDVVSVEPLNLDGTEVEVFNSVDQILRPAQNRIDIQTLTLDLPLSPSPLLALSFETPVRIKTLKRLVHDLPFNLLISRLAERVFLLAHLFCEADLEDLDSFVHDSEEIHTVNNNLRWVDLERYSNRQKTKMKLGGWVGDITYRGDFRKYLPLLKIGEYIHVGKAPPLAWGNIG